MALSTACTVWQVRLVDDDRYRVRYCCRGGPAGTFDLVLPRWSPAFADLSPNDDAGLALAAAGLILDGVLRADLSLPPESDLETLARTDPEFVPELRRRLGAVPQLS
ncbi:hypothetical protein SAMN05421837_102774 [Amycolatopsis pretoriensis]|uniref:Uncharacterized protein n=2 Tax=Amycolatopsis pretoriensis TaxID=218821 RepID=A0A1H5QGR7_9PSEU|nr:hypothetical protein [Amycolatopsis pretoriensis]SEF24578.1 hypothetical protein SAMN05421837_102774 [Amycolatopsis pretoriensis]